MREVNVSIQKESKGFNGFLIFLDISYNVLNVYAEPICTESIFAVSCGIIYGEITIGTSLKMYNQQKMISEFVRKTSIFRDKVFPCAIRTPPCGPSFLVDRDWIE